MNAAAMNGLLAEMTPDEIRELPRFVAVWLDAGLMDEDEAVQWLVRERAWAEYRRIGPENRRE